MLSWDESGLRRVFGGWLLVLATLAAGCNADSGAPIKRDPAPVPPLKLATKTPIKHVIVIFGENIAFDHYFGTYPNAANLPGEAPFAAAANTPAVNNLVTPLEPTDGFNPVMGVDLLHQNPNAANPDNQDPSNPAFVIGNPFRLAPAQAHTVGMSHAYSAEQGAANGGAMDLFPLATGNSGPPPSVLAAESAAAATRGLVMGYFDGNTVSALWNFAQKFALNDNSWSTTFGPSTPGAINLISGQTNGVAQVSPGDIAMLALPNFVPDGNGGFSMISNAGPLGDVCSMESEKVQLQSKNIGDLLNEKSISWGWFQGGFDILQVNENGTTGCGRSTPQTVNPGVIPADYSAHHQPFQYYASTANPSHARPSSTSAIGMTLTRDGVLDPANHQYDLHHFFQALAAGYLPAVSFLKAASFQDGHSWNSNPIDEQDFIVQVVTAVQARPEWESTAIILAYDDSDGWYDHQAPPIVNVSAVPGIDVLNGSGLCESGAQQNGPAPATPLAGADGNPAQGRCGYGTRLPLLVLSPYAKRNHVDHTLTDQSSISKFIEDNWLDGERIQLGGSFDTIAGTIENMFDFAAPPQTQR